MNRVFRIVWSTSLGMWVVASELAGRYGKGRGRSGAGAGRHALSPRRAGGGWRLRLGIAAGLMSLYLPAHAADRYWDVNKGSVGSGGTGTWDTVAAYWNASSDGVAGPFYTWDNTAIDNAVFAGTAGTVTLGGTLTANTLTFSTAGYTLTGGTLTLAGTAPTIAADSGTTTIGSAIAGTAGLTKTGSGALVLSGPLSFSGGLSLDGSNRVTLSGTNTFTGGITIGSGAILYATSDAALGDGANGITVESTATLNLAAPTSRTVDILSGATASLTGAGAGSAFFTGSGNVSANNGVVMGNDASDYTGTTRFNGANGAVARVSFTSIADLGQASSLGAPTTVADGTVTFATGNQYSDIVSYIGDGDSSNRNWFINGRTLARLINQGTGSLSITGDVGMAGAVAFEAQTADLQLLGEISGANRSTSFQADAGHTIVLGGANTFTGAPTISGGGVVAVSVLADAGANSSLGAGTAPIAMSGTTLSYTGAGASSNREWTISGASPIDNDGSGALTLSGAASFTAGGVADTLRLGGDYTGTNAFSGVISGAGDLASDGAGTWVLTGANTRSGALVVDGGTLRAGSATAFGTVTGATVNGGTLDLGGYDLSTGSLGGSGGTVALGGGDLTVNAATGTSSAFAGQISGSGGLTKRGAGTFTLSGANTYTGTTTVGGGTLALDFTAAGAPAGGIIAGASTLDMAGGTLSVNGAAAASDTQSFDGLNVTGGNNVIKAIAGSGGSVTVNFGTITHTGGLIDFGLPASGSFTTTSTTLGGWATVNGTDYAKVVGGSITAFTDADYTDNDNAATWQSDQYISDVDGYYGTVGSTLQLAGLRYTVPTATTVTVADGQTLGVDGTIIVAPTVAANGQRISGGSITGTSGGGALGVQQNSTGNFTIASQVVDNGGSVGFTKAGTGRVTLANAGNSYTGATTVSQGTLSVNGIADGGLASSIGASAADPANLVLQGATLQYTGGTASSDRGFTIGRSGAIASDTIQVTQAAANLTFGGQVVSPDGANLVKTGPGTLTLANGGNGYTGSTTVSGGTLSVTTLADGGANSSIGASSNASSSLVLQTGGTLQYTGASVTSDRGFTLAGVSGGTIDVTQAGTTLELTGAAVGAAGAFLHKEGAGTLVLSGTNTYAAQTYVDEGTLRAGSTQAFGGPNTMNLADAAGATLDLAGFDNKVAGLEGGGTAGGDVLLGGATLTIGGTNASFGGSIGGNGGLIKENNGTQAMVGCNNSYTGATTIRGGTLSVDCLADGGQASGIGASSSDSTNLVFNNAALNYTGGTTSTDRGFQLLSRVGAIGVTDAASTLGFGGDVIGGGWLRKDGAGTLVLSGSNSYTGGTVITGGTLRAGTGDAFGTGWMSLYDTAGVLLDLDGYDTSVSYLTGGGAAGGNIQLDGATLTVATGSSQANATYAGAIGGSGQFVKNGASLQYLSGTASTYAGPTTINGGTLAVNSLADGNAASSIGASGNAAANLVLNGGTLQYLGAGSSTDRLFSLGPSATSALDASGTGALQFTNGGAIAFTDADTTQTVTLTGSNTADNGLALQITDNGTGETSLSKTGTGTWILRNPGSTYTGITTIQGGVLGVDKLADGGQASSIGASSGDASSLVIGSGSTLRYTGSGDTTDRLFTLSSGVSFIEASGTGAVVFSNTGSAAYAGTGNRTLALGGTNTGLNTMGGTIIDGPGGATTLAKNGPGTWALTGTNTYTGNTVINGGILQLGNGGTSGAIASASIIVSAGTLAFDRADTLTLDGTISGGGEVIQQGTGTSVLTAANTYSGGTRIRAGTLQLGDGGANGSIVGDVADDGLLAFNRSDVYTFGGTVSGAGGVSQRGTGTTVLTAANGYKGTTAIRAGTLLVNGDQTAATGGTTVYNGGTLGGDGTIGGTVLVQSRGTLNPGAASGAAGTLTINGTLSLANGSTLNYQFGQANVVGGPLNDLIVVHGNLGLDGTLDVSATPGGGFGPGLYRIISYDGTLFDNGLELGTTPAGTYQVQTSVANQVNLLNSDGLSLNFWDGPGGHANATIDGGDGVWQNAAGNDNWADQSGQFNAPYTDGEFAIFMGTPGTVTVDGGLGAVTSSGMQFAVDGYTVTGDTLTLGGAPNIVRVGDGTAAGATMTATIDATLAGSGGLVKEDIGTLVLEGANTYAGGTTINDGTLQIAADASLGAAGGGLAFDGGTLRNTAAVTSARAVTINQDGATFETLADLGLSGPIGGAGGLVKTGTGTLTLGGNNSYAGGTTIDAGRVVVSSDANLGHASGALRFEGGVLENTAAFTSGRTVTLNGPGGRFLTDADLTLAGAIGGAGSLAKDGGGTLVLGADNGYAGGTLIQAGTLQLGDGGTSGSILGAVTNNGTLVFDRSDSLAFAGVISGTGAVEQHGTGITVLGGANTYAGPTAVRAGSLVVNGDQGGATGATSVDAGGTLGGKGVIGGDVSLADGATLSPGDVGSAPGTLTIRGGLGLSDASHLDVDFGQANVVGGPFNDLVQVGGDLALDGTLDVSVSSGGSFDPGIYRIIGYDGALTDGGMTIGSVPSPDYFLQTSIAHQVNLVNTAGLPVNFWDGAGARGDGQVQGGDGVWQDAHGNDDWTVTDGSINAPYQDSAFAIFTGVGGTVTVDGSLGAVNSGGMQFAVDGYRVAGDRITLNAAPAIIRVGDGTTAGAGMTATIASTLEGAGGMTKSDLGTLVLAGDNTYTGGTTISGGTLQLGEGGTTGSVAGDVVDNGTLAFDRADFPQFAGLISGSGGVEQRGGGGTALYGDNTYAGATTIRAGTLFINGDQSAATGATSVLSSGTLGGEGTVGGDVSVADGGRLSPGAAQATAGTLTINGDLTLAAGAQLDYQFGQAGTVGGPLNDQTVVHGDLTLDGELDLSATPGGSFGPGVYRIFSYDGTLTDRGLSLSASPTTDLYVQTSLANQVNLVNSAGLTLNFWDGPGHANDGAIAGGDGTWRLADNDYWTDATGSLNAPYSNGALAVFGGAAGTVTIDDTNGAVSASGLQFTSDGYRLTGGDLTLAGGASSVRVGDGTSAGTDMTATIDAAITGSGMLVKDDLGTLILAGSNAYTGGTEVRAGTLQVASDDSLGHGSGALSIDDATLHTTGSFLTDRGVGLGGAASFDVDGGTTLLLAGDIAGTGSLTKAGEGTLILRGGSSYRGATTVAQGSLSAAADGAFNASSAFAVGAAGTLDLAGHAQRVASLENAGTVRFGSAPGATLTVQGNYTGQGGTLFFNTALGGDDSATDRLVVAGDSAGSTTVRVTNVGGAGAQTTQGIKLIDVQGASNGSFVLQGDYVFQGEQAVIAGAYAYRLYQGTDGTADGDWYLRSALTSGTDPGDGDPPGDPGDGGDPGDPGDPGDGDPGNPGGDPAPLYQPGVPLYEAYAGALRAANELDTLQQRTGSRSWAVPQADDTGRGEGLWMRVDGADQTYRPRISTSDADYDVSAWKVQAGVDTTLADAPSGTLVGGVALRAGRFRTDVRSVYGQGRIRTDAYGIGATLTWYGSHGFYVDGQAHWSRFDTELRSSTLGRVLDDGNDGDGYAVGVELGQRIGLGEAWSLIPQAQLGWGRAAFDRFQDSYGTPVAFRSGTDVTGRAGLAVDYRAVRQGAKGAITTHAYAIANLYRQFEGEMRVDVAGTGLVAQDERPWGGLGLGGALDWAGGRYSIYGQVQARSSLSHFRQSHSLDGTIGFRMRW